MNPLAQYWWLLPLSYAVGSIPFGLVIGLVNGVDIRRKGSGNIGATQVGRLIGKFWSAVALLLDVAKSAVFVAIALCLTGDRAFAIFLGVTAVFGHCFPPYGTRGGKGVSSVLGVALMLHPKLALIALLVFVAVTLKWRYVSLGSIVGVATYTLAASFISDHQLVKIGCWLLFALVVMRHEANIERLLDGEEQKFSFKKGPKPVVVGFTVNADISEPAYYREKLRKKWYLRWVPMPDWLIEWLKGHVNTLSMGRIRGIRSEAGGAAAEMVFVAVTRSAGELKADERRGVGQVVKAVLRCARKGARLVGLGGFTAIIGGKGTEVARRVKSTVEVTTGNSLTAWCAIQSLRTMAWRAGYSLPEETVTIIGGGGSIGKVAAKLLLKMGVGQVLLVGRSGSNLAEAALEVGDGAFWTDDLRMALRRSRLVVAVSSATGELDLDPLWFRPYTICVDMARPRNLGRLVEGRTDVLVLGGGIYRLPGTVRSTFRFGLDPDEVLACMAETIVLALEGRLEPFSLGPDLDVNRVEEVGALAEKHGLVISRSRSCDDKPIPEGQIETFVREAKRREQTR